MMSLTFGLFTQVSGSGPLGPLVYPFLISSLCNFSIEGEYVPKEGDDVSFKLCPLPFNPEKVQATHVKITHLAPGVSHETWNAERSPTGSPRS